MENKIKKINLQLIIAILLVAIYLLLISVQPINAHVLAEYDDLLMVEQARTILSGEYLGEYTDTTLVKGIFTPLFICLLYIIGIPFIIGQNIFYILSIAFFINAIKKKVQNRNVLLLIFTILLFNPIMFSQELCRMYRDGIYVSLIIFLISSILGIFLNRNEKCKNLIGYYISLGLSFASIYICREETVWVLPFLIISLLIIVLFIVFDKKCIEKTKKLLLYIIPILIFTIIIIVICSLNYKYYGVFQLNQYWSKEFKEAYGAMTRVLPEEEIEKVPVTRKTMQKLSEISPAFSEISTDLQTSTFKWSLCGDGPAFETQGGWTHWAIMEATKNKGYYENATKTNDFYQTMANEINEACDSGIVRCLPKKRVSNICRFNTNDILNTIKQSTNTIKYEYTLEDLEIEIDNNVVLNTELRKKKCIYF